MIRLIWPLFFLSGCVAQAMSDENPEVTEDQINVIRSLIDMFKAFLTTILETFYLT